MLFANDVSLHVARTAGRSPVILENSSCRSTSERYSTNFHASVLRSDFLKITRLDPPARETPGVCASRPGRGAVFHLSWSSGGRRFLNSPTFHGPVTYMAKKPSLIPW